MNTKRMLEEGYVLAAADMVRHIASQVQTTAAARKLDEAYSLIRDAYQIVADANKVPPKNQ